MRSIEYQATAEHFFNAAKDAMDLEYWTAAGVLIVHSAIAFADALTIRFSGEKSAGENHEETIALLEALIADGDQKTKALNQLRRIIEEKSRVSYSGELFTAHQIEDMWKRVERFRQWALQILTA